MEFSNFSEKVLLVGGIFLAVGRQWRFGRDWVGNFGFWGRFVWDDWDIFWIFGLVDEMSGER